MDHHCPWINNCVSYSNYKQFFLLVAYLTVYSFYFVATSLEYIIEFFKDMQERKDSVHFIGGYVFTVVACVLFAVLLGYHVQLIRKNETTIESLKEAVFCEGNMTFDLGCGRNLREVFGDNKVLWFVPVFSSLGDGYTFHVLNRVL
ncbi:unnamed protein product [Brassicogethes aeneus]|uniref:Palmitoyltransferase n=1 Tax=Brassicogethes aeneus TaxID=1431903 RepID=A0A9P0BEE6_BRAAE|nr:unnamed protein product [Brassicogethes aeneus]